MLPERAYQLGINAAFLVGGIISMFVAPPVAGAYVAGAALTAMRLATAANLIGIGLNALSVADDAVALGKKGDGFLPGHWQTGVMLAGWAVGGAGMAAAKYGKYLQNRAFVDDAMRTVRQLDDQITEMQGTFNSITNELKEHKVLWQAEQNVISRSQIAVKQSSLDLMEAQMRAAKEGSKSLNSMRVAETMQGKLDELDSHYTRMIASVSTSQAHMRGSLQELTYTVEKLGLKSQAGAILTKKMDDLTRLFKESDQVIDQLLAARENIGLSDVRSILVTENVRNLDTWGIG
jgi:hypothetical protein